jgi:hypothetical protein
VQKSITPRWEQLVTPLSHRAPQALRHTGTVHYSCTSCDVANPTRAEGQRSPHQAARVLHRQTSPSQGPTHLPQLMVTSSGLILLFNIPILGWLPRPQNNPGGSILKLLIFSLWPSKIQYPNSC